MATAAPTGGRPLVAKLGIAPGARVALIDAPPEFERALEPLPEGVRLSRRPRGAQDVIVLFAPSATALDGRFPRAMSLLDAAGGLWVAYPKKSSGVRTDVGFERVQATGLEAGLVDNKSCAVDETWTALRFVYRLRDRPR